MFFELLGALASVATETVSEKVGEVKEGYEKYYDDYSRRTENWDDQRLIDEYKRACSSGNISRKMAMMKILQERGLTNS